MNTKISVILPAYNEEKAIGQVIDEVTTVLRENGYDFEILVVDDASTDKTAEITRKKNVRCIQHTFNRGVGAARKTGVLNARGEIIVMLDADGTYPTKSIPELLRYFPAYDQVIGCRISEQGTLKILRQIVKWIMCNLASFLVKQKIPDLNSGFRALKKDILLKYLHLIPNGFSCVSTMTLVFLCNDYSVEYIPIEYYKRIGKSKFRIFVNTRDFLFTIVRIIMYFNPLRIFIPISFIIFLLGSIKTIHSIYFSAAKNMQAADVALIIIAFIILTLGLVADLVVVQNRRQS